MTSVDIIDGIFAARRSGDRFVLSNGHAGLALYVVLEKWHGFDAERLLADHGVHPCRDLARHIHCSTGSLGMGISVACGLALGNRDVSVDCLVSDGECSEGVVWETLAFKHRAKLSNLKVHVNLNGFSAYDAVDAPYLIRRLRAFDPAIVIHTTLVGGIDDHYRVLNRDEYETMLRRLDSCRDVDR